MAYLFSKRKRGLNMICILYRVMMPTSKHLFDNLTCSVNPHWVVD